MSYQALLFCPDEKTARTVTQVLSELDFSVEAVAEPFAVVKKLMSQHYDAIVADCENEQNASLIFKSARNSTSNQSSLFVAVVEGQAGVAKAFRIGANLVLTKPINVEQSKGTLRVARGLLRKNADSAKAAPTQAHAAPVPPAPRTQAPAPAPPPQVPTVRADAPPEPVKAPSVAPKTEPEPMVAAAFSATNELETEPEIIELDATDTAMLESLGNPVPSPTSIAPPKPLELPKVTPVGKAASTIIPITTPNTAATTPSTSNYEKPAPAKPSIPPAPPRPFLAPKSVGQGAAAAPALAKEPLQASPVELPVAELPPTEKIETTDVAGSAAQTLNTSPFTTLDSPQAKPDSSSGSKTPFIAVAAVLVLGALGYFGYTQFHGKSTASPTPSAAASAPQTAPAPTPATPVADATVTASALPEPSTSAVSNPPSTTTKTAPLSQSPSPKPAASNLIAPDKTVTLENPAAIVVKADSSRPATAAPQPQDQGSDAAPAPLGVAMGSGSQDKALSSIVSSTPAVPTAAPPQVVNISQGVSQGLLLKRVQPNYPSQAVSLRIEGPVNLQATIAKDGTIKGVKVLGGHPLLARAAADAVRQWRYKPYMLNGQPFEVQTEITVNFKLPN
jgi:periplasmic protein TonB